MSTKKHSDEPIRNPLEIANNVYKVFRQYKRTGSGKTKQLQISSRAVFAMGSMVNSAISDLMTIVNSVVRSSKKRTITGSIMQNSIKIIMKDDFLNEIAAIMKSSKNIETRNEKYINHFKDNEGFGIRLGRAKAIMKKLTPHNISLDACALLVGFFSSITLDIVMSAEMTLSKTEKRIDTRHLQAGVAQTLRTDAAYGHIQKMFNGFFLVSHPIHRAGDRLAQDAEDGKTKKRRKNPKRKTGGKKKAKKTAYNASGFDEFESEEEEEGSDAEFESEDDSEDDGDGSFDF